jgi:hypothetical protein
LVGLYWQGKEKVFAIDPVVDPVGTLVAVVVDPVVVETVGAL